MQKPRLIAGLATLVVLLSAGIAWAALPPGGTFTDDDGNIFEGAIEAIAAEGITRGCNPPANTRFCPDDPVTRGQMAIFIARAYDLPPASDDFFADDAGKVYEDAANRLAQAGLTHGCAPGRYCGDDTISRGEMAAFLSRAEKLPDSTTDHFVDDNTSIFEPGINKVADARITLGCNPPTNTNFCPNSNVIRGQMAGFLTRALGLTPTPPPPRATTTTTTTTTSPTPPPPGSSNWSCNAFSSFYSCSGNTDPIDLSTEFWSCDIFSSFVSCSGNIDKTDLSSEFWSCDAFSSFFSCSGNIDKRDLSIEFWSCNIFTSFTSCSGNINRDDISSEFWSCDFFSSFYSCSGNIDKLNISSESWSCEVFSSFWSCDGDSSWLSPVVDTFAFPSTSSLQDLRASQVAPPSDRALTGDPRGDYR